MWRLDEVISRETCSSQRVFLKIDVQGYERQVLEGANGILDQIVGIQLEMDLEELYEGGDLIGEALGHAAALGFSVYSITPGFRDRRDGRLLQADGVFFRRERVPGANHPETGAATS